MSARRVEVLIEHLPQESAYVSKVAPDAWRVGAWSTTDHMLAEIWNLYVAANTKAGRKPAQYMRPADMREHIASTMARHAALEAQAERAKRRLAEGG